MLRFRCVRGSRTPLVGRLLLTLLVPNDTVAGMCHALFPDSAMTPAKNSSPGPIHKDAFTTVGGAGRESTGVTPHDAKRSYFHICVAGRTSSASGTEPVLDVSLRQCRNG